MESKSDPYKVYPTSTGVLAPKNIVALVVIILSVVTAFLLAKTDALLGPLWLLTMLAGFTLQRSRFCFTSAFRDIFLFGNSQIMKGILVGLTITTVGFAIIMFRQVPFPAFGALPPEAQIMPVGISTIVGGILFGFGMVLAGGCASGSLYRMAEGYVGSWVAIAGILIGLGFISQTWNHWWRILISHEHKIWLPSTMNLGYSGSLALTLTSLGFIFLLLVWWESRNDISIPRIIHTREPELTFKGKLSSLWEATFVRGWSPIIGGAVLGVIATFIYMVHMPWGVTGELARWANGAMTNFGIPPPDPLGLSDIGGCAGRSDQSGIFTHTFAVTVGVLPGSLVGALFAGEFKLRFPPHFRRYIQSLSGGIFMGCGSGLAIGCTIGAFFSSIPSLSISGWLFAMALCIGAFLGVQAIKRIP